MAKIKQVPFDKQSKKVKKAFYRSQRGSWHGVNPVTRKTKSAKQYDRSAFKSKEED